MSSFSSANSNATNVSKSTSPIILDINRWDTNANKYMQPKINKSGGKAITLISKQTNRSLHLTTPLMMTWGIADFVDERGESDGKFSISLNFPLDKDANVSTEKFLTKMKDFENQILDDAVTNSESWWGEHMSREIVKHTFFPFLKYQKNKETKKIDSTKPPSIRAKVPCYDGKWAVEVYDTKGNMIFPCENEDMTPMDFVPKQSNVACVIQCGGIWIGGKGWGLTWKLIQCVVKPYEVVSVYGKCHIQLSNEDTKAIENQEPEIDDFDDIPGKETTPLVAPVKSAVVKKELKVETEVEDSDNEEDMPLEPPPLGRTPSVDFTEKDEDEVTTQMAPPPVEEEEVVPVKTSSIPKKIVKKSVPVTEEPAHLTPVITTEEPKKKKIIKKVAV
jgi:hypothetical protein